MYKRQITNSTSGTAYSDPSTGPYSYTPNATSSILATDIQNSLNNGTNVKISTGLSGSLGGNAGNITVAANIAKTSGTAASLTLEANNAIIFNSGVAVTGSSTAGNLDVNLTANGAASSGSSVVFNSLSKIDTNGKITINATSKITGSVGSPAAVYVYAGNLTNSNTGGSRTLIRGSSLEIKTYNSGAITM